MTTPLWQHPISVEAITAMSANSAVSHLGIEFLAVGDDFITARVPVDARTLAANYASPPGHQAVGLDINANHLRGVRSGWVTGTARPVHIGRTTQVWQIDLRNDAGELTCASRITMAVLAPK